MKHSPLSTSDLSPAERRFLGAMAEVGFGRFEQVRISNGALVLDPWPRCIRDVKFGAQTYGQAVPGDFELKSQALEFFEYVRGVDSGAIAELEVRHGLPFSMEIDLGQHQGDPNA